jgi:hypothetical protein
MKIRRDFGDTPSPGRETPAPIFSEERSEESKEVDMALKPAS